MKNRYLNVILILACLITPRAKASEPIVKQNTIEVVNSNMRVSTPIVLSTLIFDAPEPGQVVLRLDGYCVSDSGDRIILAASNKPEWSSNGGSVHVQAPHTNFQRRSFSHTRVYDVAMGLDTFYAVGQNYVDENGSGIASVYGHLTMEFFPASGAAMVIDSNITFSGNVRTSQKVIAKVFSPAEPVGNVLVHLDGYTYSDPGDRIMLSASNVPSWIVGTGSVAVMALNATQALSPFSHSQVYTQNSSPDTFYAVVRNVVNQSGSGNANFFGNLSAEFFPSSGVANLSVREIDQNDLNARGAPVAFDSITITAPVAGYALAQFDGYCTSSVGDELLFAVNETPSWEFNSGHVTVSAPYSNNNFSTISHSRLFPVAVGTHTYYSVVENYGATGGNGLVDILANFTVKFYPEVQTGIEEVYTHSFSLYPNPANGVVTIWLNDNDRNQTLYITDIAGRVVYTSQTGMSQKLDIYIANLPAGMYLVKINNSTEKLVKQ